VVETKCCHQTPKSDSERYWRRTIYSRCCATMQSMDRRGGFPQENEAVAGRANLTMPSGLRNAHGKKLPPERAIAANEVRALRRDREPRAECGRGAADFQRASSGFCAKRGACSNMPLDRDLSGHPLRRRDREAIGDLSCARELLKEMVAQGATVFALDSDVRFHFDPAKAGVALRAHGIVSLHAPSLAQHLRQIQ